MFIDNIFNDIDKQTIYLILYVEQDSAPLSSTTSLQESFSERPPYSYMAMIQFAINSTEKKRMMLKDIYSWIEDHFPYFKHVAKPGWKNSIRHNLSLHDMFVRETSTNGKISFWTIHPEANRYLTLDQVFKQKRHALDLQKNIRGSSGSKSEPQTALSLPELTETVSDLVLRTPRMLVLGDFNLHAETGLTGAAQDFMVSIVPMGLSQHVTGPTHERGHTLDLVFSTGQEEGGLRVRNLCLTPLSWSDHFLVRFVLESDLSLCKGADPIV
ncbi:Forkhead box protein M1 [Varanus komodoensis]|nr:Forkhead box protein M1 [Varanus komodoensis]